MLAAGDVDHIDPGAAYYQFTYMVTSATQRPLLAWQPDDVEDPTPDLADGRADGLERQQDDHLQDQERHQVQPAAWRWRGAKRRRDLGRRQVRDRARVAARSGERLQGRLPRRDLDGFKEAQAAAAKDPTKAPGHQRHRDAPTTQTIVFQLDKPIGAVVEQALSLPISAPVRRSSRRSTTPRTPPPTASTRSPPGRTTSPDYQPGKDIPWIRNPNWDPNTDWRPAYLDKVDIQEGFADTVSACKKILTGSAR